MPQELQYIVSDEELEVELKKLKELNRKIVEALHKAKDDYRYVKEYENAVQEYEDAKSTLFARLQR